MKKRYILMAVTAALVFAVAAGGTLAATRVQNDTAVVANLASKTLDIEWKDMSGKGETTVLLDNNGKPLMPGDEVTLPEPLAVTNQDAVNGYVRVTVTKSWATINEDGTYTPVDNLDVNEIALSDLTDVDGCKWIKATSLEEEFFGTNAEDPNTYVYYYSEPLMGGTTSQDLLKSVAIQVGLGNEYQNKAILITAVAESVQYVEADGTQEIADLNAAGIESAWGVQVTIDPDTGAITSYGY